MMAAALLALLAVIAQDPTPPVPQSDSRPGAIMFVAQCRYRSGVKALLYHGFSAGDFILALRSGSSASSWRITPHGNGDVMLDTVTVGPTQTADANAAIGLYRWLLQRHFRAVRNSRFEAETAHARVGHCPEPYPFSN